jgi:hypothetical protein
MEAIMRAKLLKQTVERSVVDSSGWRSQPKSARVSLPYLRVLDETVMPMAGLLSDPDGLAGRGRIGLGY